MKLSILIPVYNTEKFLPVLLDSCLLWQEDVVLNDDYEIICINDGSKDHSLSVLREYEEKYGIKVIDKSNSGVSDTRNVGLSYAQGEYVWFVDSDDYIAPNCLSKIFSEVKNMTEDCLIINYRHVKEENDNELGPICESLQIVPQGKWRGGKKYSMPWLHVIRRSFLVDNKIFFDSSLTHQEDTIWRFFCDLHGITLRYSSTECYAYRQRRLSALREKSIKNGNNYNNSIHKMVSIYCLAKKEYEDSIIVQKIDIDSIIYDSVANVLFSELRRGEKNPWVLINELKEKSLYPYPFLWRRLDFRYGMKAFVLQLFELGFPLTMYYVGCFYLYRLLCRVSVTIKFK